MKKKRYCLVSFCNIYLLPYAKIYIDAINSADAECDLLFWDRDAVNGENDKFDNCNKLYYQKKITPESSGKDKLLGYIGARNYFVNCLKSENYDGVIFLQTHTAVACKGLLSKKYKGKYIVDVRDYTLENINFYRKLEQSVIADSYATVISSPAYKKFLPDGNFVVAHNFSQFPEERANKIKELNKNISSEPIRISFVGTVRFIEMDKKILKCFANDERFQVNYYGTGSDVLKAFCENESINNVDFHGSFSPDKTLDFYEKTDLINNLYGNHNPFVDYALSNKLYHSGQLHIPILVCSETYMEDVSLEYNMGYVFDVDKNGCKDDLYEWYCNLDGAQFSKGCDEFISNVKKENVIYQKVIRDFLSRD